MTAGHVPEWRDVRELRELLATGSDASSYTAGVIGRWLDEAPTPPDRAGADAAPAGARPAAVRCSAPCAACDEDAAAGGTALARDEEGRDVECPHPDDERGEVMSPEGPVAVCTLCGVHDAALTRDVSAEPDTEADEVLWDAIEPVLDGLITALLRRDDSDPAALRRLATVDAARAVRAVLARDVHPREADARYHVPSPPPGSKHWRDGWRNGYEQCGIDRAREAEELARDVPAGRDLTAQEHAAAIARAALAAGPDELARLREIEAAVRAWMVTPGRSQTLDDIGRAHRRLVAALARDVPAEPLHEVQCPSCETTIRARMADAAARPAGDDTAPREHNHLNSGVYGGCPGCGTDFAAAGPRAGDDTAPDPQPVNADLRDRIRNYPGDGPHQAGAGDTAPDDDCVSPARIAAYELRQLTKCRCEFPVSAMGQHDRECASDNREYVDTLIAEVHRLRSDAAALRAAGNESDDVLGALLRELAPIPWGLHEDATAALDRWQSAAGSPATTQPPADALRGLLAEARDLIDRHLGDRSQTARVLLRRIDAATDDAQEGQR